MDVAYNQHSSHARRNNKSNTSLNHLSLVPLTMKLPLSDHDDLPGPMTAPLVLSTSYLQGKSAPTTPALLSRSPARSRSHTRLSSSNGASLPKSKSATHLTRHRHKAGSGSGAVSPSSHRRRGKEDGSSLSAKDRNDSDWMLRAGAVLSGEYREYKGQAWLVSRASSTSLTGVRDADAEEVAFERELAREREHAGYHHHQSRRGSTMGADDELPSPNGNGSRLGSRSQSRTGSLTQMMTPKERRSIDGYFVPQELSSSSSHHFHLHQQHELYHQHQHEQHMVAGPDFVNLDEKLEAIEQDTSIEDEATVRRLVKREQGGGGGAGFWLGSVLGWSLFSVEENEEEESDDDGDDDTASDDDEDEDADAETGTGRSGETTSDTDSGEDSQEGRKQRYNLRQLEGITVLPEEKMPPPRADEGGWHDAAWLLSVASKVLL